MFKNIFRLQPGHILVVDEAGVRTRKYWDIDYSDLAAAFAGVFARTVPELLEESVRLRLIAEVSARRLSERRARFQRHPGHDEQDRRRRPGEDLQRRL